jgi:hypothetical protein
MSLAEQALAIARLQTGQGPADARARLAAWDRLQGLLSTLDSKTSSLLRFNAIVVAALAYLLIVSGADPLANGNATARQIGMLISHASLLASILSCGFAFPVIAVERDFFGVRYGVASAELPELDDSALAAKAALVTRRTRYYVWAWRLAVAGGGGFAILVGLATLHLK